MAGDAAETPWVQSTLLTPHPEPVMPLAGASPTGRAGEAQAQPLIISAILVLLDRGQHLRVRRCAPRSIPVASNLVVLALLNLNVIVFLLLLVLLFRNLVKLCFERRQKVIGARFKAKLVLAFLSLALVPSILIFIIASNFITTSIEGWFKPQVERPLDQALEVAQTYYQTLETTALRHGRFMARVVEREGLMSETQRERPRGLSRRAARPARALRVDAVRPARPRGAARQGSGSRRGAAPRAIAQGKVAQGLGGQEVTTVQEIENGDMIQAVVPVRDLDREVIGTLVVSTHVAQRLENRLRGISQAFQEYKQLKLLKNPIKGIYILLFLLMTLIIVFSATWFGLYLARGITEPIQMLAEGTREVAAGNLGYKVQVRADDEIGILVDSFNQMTSDLGSSKSKLEDRPIPTSRPNTTRWRCGAATPRPCWARWPPAWSRWIAAGRITTINGAAERMLGIPAAGVGGDRGGLRCSAGRSTRRSPPWYQRMARLREGTVEREVHLRRDGQAITLLASATALKGPDGTDMGMVLVFDDLTELLKAQRLAAWREVAQRIAHEIKNPLTPDPALRPAAAAAAGRGRQRRGEASPRGGHLHHHPGGGRAQAAGGRVLPLRAHARPGAASHRPRAAARRRVRALP